jgi:hypothetical protein
VNVLPGLLTVLLLAPLQLAPSGADPESAPTLRFRIPPPPHLVGQPLHLHLEPADRLGRDGSPVLPRRFRNAILGALPDGLVLVPLQPGPLLLPAMGWATAERTQRIAPARFTIQSLPPPPPGFMGAVGPVSIHQDVAPAALQAGQAATWTITLEGPGALGSTRSPARTRLESLSIAPEITRVLSRVSFDPPSRTLQYRLRPTRAGQVALPPVVVPWFDPATGQYQAVTAPSVPFSVAPRPVFPLETLVDSPEATPAPRASQPPAPNRWIPLLASFWSLALVATWLIRRRRALIAPRLAMRNLAQAADADLPTAVPAALARLLDAPAGALTPSEASQAVLATSGDTALAAAASRLVAWCDAQRFAPVTMLDPALRPAALWLAGRLTTPGTQPPPSAATR